MWIGHPQAAGSLILNDYCRVRGTVKALRLRGQGDLDFNMVSKARRVYYNYRGPGVADGRPTERSTGSAAPPGTSAGGPPSADQIQIAA